jgi:Polyketide cyclase / dehydrase and lipid transport
MATIKRGTNAFVEAEAAWQLWTDVSRWAAFMEGFKHLERESGNWPAEGAKIQWVSIPGGRGTVSEKVIASEPPRRLVTQVFEDAMTATQTVTFGAVGDLEETWIEFELEYRLTQAGFLRQITDVLFIRRALAAAIDRTLRRFATEAEDEAAL